MCLKMLKSFWKEFLAVAAVTAVGFLLVDLLSKLLFPAEKVNVILSSTAMLIGLAAIVVMFAIPFVASFFGGRMIAKKGAEHNEAIFVPAIGAVVGTALVMLVSAVQIFLSTDAFLQEQMSKMSASGIDMSNITPAEFRTGMILSVFIGILVLSAVNFGIGAIGGLLAKSTFKNKK